MDAPMQGGLPKEGTEECSPVQPGYTQDVSKEAQDEVQPALAPEEGLDYRGDEEEEEEEI